MDRAIPVQPAWLFVYVAIFFMAFLPLLTIRHRPLFRRVAASYFLVQVMSYTIFVFLPTRSVHRPVVAADSFLHWALVLTYWLDYPNNCFPSLHVSLSFLAAFCCIKVDRLVGGVAFGVAVAVALSTLFVKQHFAVDVLGGFLLASLSYSLCLARFDLEGSPPQENRYPRGLPSLLLPLYGATVLAFVIAYLADWRPWLGAA